MESLSVLMHISEEYASEMDFHLIIKSLNYYVIICY